MAGFSTVVVEGYVARDIEIRYTKDNKAVGNFCVAHNKYAGKGKEEKPVFIDVTVWEKQAELVDEWFRKGAAITVVGELDMDEWEDKNGGGKRTKLFITARSIHFPCGKSGDGEGGGRGGGRGKNRDEDSREDRGGGRRRSRDESYDADEEGDDDEDHEGRSGSRRPKGGRGGRGGSDVPF